METEAASASALDGIHSEYAADEKAIPEVIPLACEVFQAKK